jgi:hypothetical protein
MVTWPFPGVKRQGRGVDHAFHLAPKLKKEKGYTSTHRLGLRGLFKGELYLTNALNMITISYILI